MKKFNLSDENRKKQIAGCLVMAAKCREVIITSKYSFAEQHRGAYRTWLLEAKKYRLNF